MVLSSFGYFDIQIDIIPIWYWWAYFAFFNEQLDLVLRYSLVVELSGAPQDEADARVAVGQHQRRDQVGEHKHGHAIPSRSQIQLNMMIMTVHCNVLVPNGIFTVVHWVCRHPRAIAENNDGRGGFLRVDPACIYLRVQRPHYDQWTLTKSFVLFERIGSQTTSRLPQISAFMRCLCCMVSNLIIFMWTMPLSACTAWFDKMAIDYVWL